MEDLTQKIESIFGVRKFGHSIDSCQNIADPVGFISDVVDLLPKILEHYDKVNNQLKQIVMSSNSVDDDNSENDGVSDDLYSDEANLMKVCFGLCIRLLAALFTWPEFDNDTNKNTLKSKFDWKIFIEELIILWFSYINDQHGILYSILVRTVLKDNFFCSNCRGSKNRRR